LQWQEEIGKEEMAEAIITTKRFAGSTRVPSRGKYGIGMDIKSAKNAMIGSVKALYRAERCRTRF
jgi:hypothetical protein